MIYEFVDTETGERVEIPFPAGKAPGDGEVIEHEGRRVRRVLSIPAGFNIHGTKPFVPFVSESQQVWHPDAPAHTPDGKPVFQSRREQATFVDKNNARAQTEEGKKAGFREIGVRDD